MNYPEACERPSLGSALAAPWTAIVRPERSGEILARCGPLAILVVFIIQCAILIVVLCGLFAAERMVDLDYSNATLNSGPGYVGTYNPDELRVIERNLTEAIHVWWSDTGKIWFTFICVILGAIAFGLTALLTVTFLPEEHGEEPVHQSLWRGFRRAISVSGPLNGLTLTIGLLICATANHADRRIVLGSSVSEWAMILPPLTAMACVFLVCRAWRIMSAPYRGAVDTDGAHITPSSVRSFLCEGCGYDLTHVSSDGRCTECGLDVETSLNASTRRIGCGWQIGPTLDAWLSSTLRCVARPHRFYSRLRLHQPPSSSSRFVRPHYVLMGVMAASWSVGLAVFVDTLDWGLVAWICVLLGWLVIVGVYGILRIARLKAPLVPFLVLGYTVSAAIIVGIRLNVHPTSFITLSDEWSFLAMSFSMPLFIVPLAGWGTKRIVLGIVALIAYWRRALRAPEYLAIVGGYETAYLWAFCAFNGLALSAMALTDLYSNPGIQDIARTVVGLPAEPAVILVGNGALIGLWFWRYWIAIRAVRWSNF